MNDLERGFIAGLLEGEGSIYRPHSPQLIIYNSNYKLLEFVQRIIGGKIHERHTGLNAETPSYRLVLCGNSVCIILKEILPLLFVKKQRALEILKYNSMKT